MVLGNNRILVVDDDKIAREILQRGLTQAGYTCAAAESVEDAAGLLKVEEEWALVLLDIVMPGRSGVDFLPEVKVQHPDVALVMLTGVADVSVAVRAMREGADDYVTKPINLGDLIIRVEHALSRRNLVLENKAYHRRLEDMVDDLNPLLEQRKREVTALNNPFHSNVSQGGEAQTAYSHLRSAMVDFNSKLEDFAAVPRFIGGDESPARYRVQTFKLGDGRE